MSNDGTPTSTSKVYFVHGQKLFESDGMTPRTLTYWDDMGKINQVEEPVTQGFGYWRIQPALEPSLYWHGKLPYLEFNPKPVPWEEDPAARPTYAHLSEYATWPPETPKQDHRYDKILEEFGGHPLHSVTRIDPAAEFIGRQYGAAWAGKEGPMLWAPPEGAFPAPEPETVLCFPKYEERVGRWMCSVVVSIIPSPINGDEFPRFYAERSRCWLQCDPVDANGGTSNDGRPTYQKWSTISPVQAALSKEFAAWVLDIEANPECCVKHKLLGHYDGSACVGQRSEAPPPAQKQIADVIYQKSPIFTRLSDKSTQGQIIGGNNIMVSSPRTGFKLHGLK